MTKNYEEAPPLRVDRWQTENNQKRLEVGLRFWSGEMTSMLVFPAEQVEEIVIGLRKSAAKALGKSN